MASNPSPDLTLTPLQGSPRTVRELLTMFHLLVVAVDPYTHESSWVFKTAARVLESFEQADVRVAWVVTAPPEACRAFLGPYAESIMTFSDADRSVVKELGLSSLPAIVHIGIDGTVVNAAEGWDPVSWKAVCDHLAKVTSWTAPVIPVNGDPAPFAGSPALG